jgi:hypothetical protein
MAILFDKTRVLIHHQRREEDEEDRRKEIFSRNREGNKTSP